jgi:diacylglycerol kinase family enzyme
LLAARHGRHIDRPEVLVRNGREVTLQADRPLPVCGDGDELAALPITVRVRPAALRLLGARSSSPTATDPADTA